MTDSFYDQYSKKSKIAKELWDTLKSVYQAEEATTKKFLISNYMDFKMTDDRPVSVQVRELQLIANDMCRINREKKPAKETVVKAHVVVDKDEKKNSGRHNQNKLLKPKNSKGFKPSSSNLKAKNKECYNCHKIGHFVKDCYQLKHGSDKKKNRKEFDYFDTFAPVARCENETVTSCASGLKSQNQGSRIRPALLEIMILIHRRPFRKPADNHSSTANRAIRMRRQPRVDARGVKHVLARVEPPELFAGDERRKAHRASPAPQCSTLLFSSFSNLTVEETDSTWVVLAVNFIWARWSCVDVSGKGWEDTSWRRRRLR
ncbi:hypothetical protein RJ639_035315 [Escallonia herrerae]|uniref:CCHC-type domain-containing protein n=1 Tax=Escallonia herrerae TaxID=1293975 RepID=A0AA88WS77_9ASTE|nr:hypothetical protein RJ639_035315 [Escallonia herrerae]